MARTPWPATSGSHWSAVGCAAGSSYMLVASLADPLSATILGVEVVAPVLVGDEIAMAHDGTPVLLATNTFRGDTYRFQVELHH